MRLQAVVSRRMPATVLRRWFLLHILVDEALSVEARGTPGRRELVVSRRTHTRWTGGPLVTDAVGTSTLFCWDGVNTAVVMCQPT